MLRRLYLHHFRNYTQAEFTFSPGVNWICGKNAQGKTNLLEAVYLLSTGRSFRTHILSELIQKQSGFFYIEAEIEKEGVSQTLKASFDGETKKVEINATTFSNFSSLLGMLPHILYAPEDIAVVAGSPSHRRKFLDLHLSQIDPLYLHHLTRYYKAMRQRNELLKARSEIAIEPWEMAMAQNACYILEKRKSLIEELKPLLLQKMEHLSCGHDPLEIQYQNTLHGDTSEELLETLQKNRKKELHIGTTLYGPHRDDVLFSIRNLSVKSYASIGQKHSAAASLRLSLFEHIKKNVDEMPLFSIDDFGAHLDPSRQKQFREELESLGQIFITSPNADPEIFPEKKIHAIASGNVLKVGGA
ncbi:MAG: DNA replication/repair protein RecF [Simkaniaceae bacterium]|nr:DNA replication/repair protein RecF [Candidatus Sacchlamyda saccharinae]